METLFLNPDVGRSDLAQLLSDIQTQEKQKLHLVSFLSTQLLNITVNLLDRTKVSYYSSFWFFGRRLQYRY